MMTELAETESRIWSGVEIDPRSCGELRGLLNQYLYSLLGEKPRMHQYLRLLSS